MRARTVALRLISTVSIVTVLSMIGAGTSSAQAKPGSLGKQASDALKASSDEKPTTVASKPSVSKTKSEPAAKPKATKTTKPPKEKASKPDKEKAAKPPKPKKQVSPAEAVGLSREILVKHGYQVVRVDPEPPQRLGRRLRTVLIRVDAVVDDAYAFRCNAVQRLDIVLHRLRHRAHTIGGLVRGALDPGGRVIRGAELLDLPRAVRLERVRRQDELRPGEWPREAAGEVRVPGVAVDDVRRLDRPDHREITHEGIEQPRMPGILCRELHCRRDTTDAEISVGVVLLTEAQDLDVVRPGVRVRELPRQVLDVHARPAIDLGRVLAREEGDLHAVTLMPFGITTIPPSLTSKRSASLTGSTPISTPSPM